MKKIFTYILVLLISFFAFTLNTKAEEIDTIINNDIEVVDIEVDNEDNNDNDFDFITNDDNNDNNDFEVITNNDYDNENDDLNTVISNTNTDESIITSEDSENNLESVIDNNSNEESSYQLNTNNYQVTFTHDGYNFSITGGSTILLSQLNQKLNINILLSDVYEIYSSDSSILNINKVIDSNDYAIKSLRSFDTEETLTIHTISGDEYIIKVTDPAGDVPEHNKDITDNHDGTYTLELSVTGDSIPEVDTSANVNVILVYDISQSMSDPASNSRYSRGDQAEAVVYKFIDDIMNYHGGGSVEMALITFAVDASTVSSWTSNLQSIRDRFDSNGENNSTKFNYTSRGTNWDAALALAYGLLGHDDDQTIVILITDGAPTASGDGSNAVAPTTASLSTLVNRYSAALPTAKNIQGTTEDKNELYGIYMYGTEADLLDDLMYNSFQPNGSERTPAASTVTNSPNYYNASDTSRLKAAVNELLGKIINAMGVSSVTISDGTTSAVQASSSIVNLLDVDDTSFEYWLSMEVTPGSETDTYINNTTGNAITFTKSGDNYVGSWTDKDGSHSITGTINPVYDEDGQTIIKYVFEMQWTNAGNALHPEAPTPAQLVTDEEGNESVDWNLSSHGVLKNGVTYTVKFRVWPSQYTLDLIADLKNHPEKWNELDDNIKLYLIKDGEGASATYTLKTNTTATLTFVDTRLENLEPDSDTFDNPDPVGTSAVETLTISKEWNNELDGREGTPVTLTILRSDEDWDTIDLGGDQGWSKNLYISIGIMTVADDGTISILTPGHDFSFGELGDDVHNWELTAKIVHPMLINGVLTMLYREGTTAPEEGTYYKIGDYYYVVGEVGENVVELKATNERRSYLELEKDVTYDEGFAHFDDALFEFTITISDDNGADIWFSVKESKVQGARYITTEDGLVVTGAVKDTESNYYIAQNGSPFTIKIKKGWNVRIINLLSGTTYTIVESGLDPKFEFVSTELTINDPDLEEPTITPGESETITGSIAKPNMVYSIIYTNKNVVTEVVVTKEWLDKDNEYETRPDSITVVLSDGSSHELNEDNDWTWTFKNLPVYAQDESTIEYTVTELEVDGYITSIDGNQADGYTITNTLLIDVDVTKEWLDKDNEYETRPENITIYLNDIEGTLSEGEDGTWSYTFEDIPLYDENKELITYELSELEVDGYETAIEGNQDDGFTITNSLLINITVTKEWVDNNNADETRPESITIYLNDIEGTLVEGEDGTWSYTFENLPIYDEDGETIEYELQEVEVPNYTSEIEETEDGYTITNTLVKSITVTKEWVDNENADETRPENITIYLNDIEGTLVEGEDGSWSYTFENLPIYDEDGETIEYELQEVEVPNYTSSIEETEEGYVITNTLVKSITVTKEWIDNNNADETRPENITIYLNDIEGTLVEGEDGSWSYIFENLPIYDENGETIEYELQEVEVPNYTSEIEETEDGFVITNTLVKSIVVTKEWIDNNNADETRPEDITIYLNDIEGTLVEGEDGTWSYIFENLPIYDENGETIEYNLEEIEVPNYTSSIEETEDGFVITNTLVKSIVVTKEWVDNNNADETRPEDITIYLNDIEGTLVEGEDGTWSYTFENLPIYDEDGEEIAYELQEVEVPNYISLIEETEDGFVITNTLVLSIEVSKTWEDEGNESNRPDKITVILLANGDLYNQADITSEDDWSYVFENLPVFFEDGKVTYTIEEVPVENYITTITGSAEDGFSITNAYEAKGTIEPPPTGIETNNNVINYNNELMLFISVICLMYLRRKVYINM